MTDITKYDDLIFRKLTNELKDTEHSEFQSLMGYPEFSKRFDSMSRIWEASASIPSEVSFDKNAAYRNFLKNRPVKSKIFSFQRYAYAAAAVLILAIAALFLFKNEAKEQSYFAEINTSFTLPDGSQIDLSKGSSLHYSTDFGSKNRNLKFEGRGLFHVVKNPKMPFNVSSDAFNINVLGTTFILNTMAQTAQVLEGRVDFEKDGSHVILTSRQGAKIVNGEIQKDEEVNLTPLEWIKPLLEYNNVPLTRVLSDLEMKFDIKFIKKSTQNISKCMFTSASLEDVGLEDIIKILELGYNFNFEVIDTKTYQFKNIDCK